MKQLIPTFAMFGLLASGAALAGDRESVTTDRTDSYKAKTELNSNSPHHSSTHVSNQQAAILASELINETVEDSSGKKVGDVEEIIIGHNLSQSKIVVDVGGFLGMGEKPVAIPMSEFNISKKSDDDYDVSITYSEKQLKSMPKWSKKAEDRVSQTPNY